MLFVACSGYTPAGRCEPGKYAALAYKDKWQIWSYEIDAAGELVSGSHNPTAGSSEINFRKAFVELYEAGVATVYIPNSGKLNISNRLAKSAFQDHMRPDFEKPEQLIGVPKTIFESMSTESILTGDGRFIVH